MIWIINNNFATFYEYGLNFYNSVAKGSKLKVGKFWGLIPTFEEVTREKLIGGFVPLPLYWIWLNIFYTLPGIFCKNHLR